MAPLEHLLRNAVAHGIELPEHRAREGKSAAGVVSLVLTRERNELIIGVADDGGGLDLEVIRRRALERGLMAESVEAGEEEIAQFVLKSGFSTVDDVSQIAGRGVGLDVVNAEVKRLSGTLGLETQSGRGTRFTIRLPLTLPS
jgi:chemosensory pili system protein ChpA (sensor histidine kinase/response regulator)